MILEEIRNIKGTGKELRKFGLTVGLVFAFIGGWMAWKSHAAYPYFIAIGAVLLTTGIFFCRILGPVYRLWMTLALMIGWVMTRVILTVLFYIAITPIALVLRLTGKDLLDLKYPEQKQSYWISRKEDINEKIYFERQF